ARGNAGIRGLLRHRPALARRESSASRCDPSPSRLSTVANQANGSYAGERCWAPNRKPPSSQNSNLAGGALRRQEVEAPEPIVDRQDLDPREACLSGISANGVGSHDGARAGG